MPVPSAAQLSTVKSTARKTAAAFIVTLTVIPWKVSRSQCRFPRQKRRAGIPASDAEPVDPLINPQISRKESHKNDNIYTGLPIVFSSRSGL